MSELRPASRPQKSTAFWRIYMMSWAVLAGGALTYLITHTAPPGALSTNMATAPNVDHEAKRAELDREQLSAQVRSLNETVASLRTDIARFKKSARERDEAQASAPQAPPASPADAAQSQQTQPQEVSNITTSSLPKPNANATASKAEVTNNTNATPSEPVTIVNAAPAATPTASQPALAPSLPAPTTEPGPATRPTTSPTVAEAEPRRKRNLATALLRPGRVPPLPPYSHLKNATPANSLSSRSAPVVRTAVTTPPQPSSFGTRVIKSRQPANLAALSLSTAQSITGLRASWLLLTTRHPNIFVGYQPRYVADQANGYYRLLAGPIANHSDADRICTELRAQNVSCGVTTYVGSAL